MISVPFKPQTLSAEQKKWFNNWLKLAAAAKSKQSSADTFQPKVWSALKQWLLHSMFHGKCAYCEVNIEASFVGDAEHYRPKGAVTELKNGKLTPVQQQNGTSHQGYYWLAYDWMNLVPSCERCNAVHGKRTKFPIRGTRVFDEATGPDSETLNKIEQPYLLHPYDLAHDPKDHLVFSPDGWVVGRDQIGKESIELLDLNRNALVEFRRTWLSAQRGDFGRKVGNAVADVAIPDINAEIVQLLALFTSPDRMFSAATRDVLSAIMAQMPRR
jgi:hypothetical protein